MTTKTPTLNRGAILARLKDTVSNLKEITEHERRLLLDAYVDAHLYCQAAQVEDEKMSTVQATRDLAQALRMPTQTMATWRQNGRFMVENAIPKSKCKTPGHVDTLRCYWQTIPRSHQLTLLSKLKDGTLTGRFLQRKLREGRALTGAEAQTLVNRFRREGKMKEQWVRLEVVKVRKLLEEYFDREVDVAILDHETADLLMNVPEE